MKRIANRAHGRDARPGTQRGFTLAELLVAVALLGGIGVAVLRLVRATADTTIAQEQRAASIELKQQFVLLVNAIPELASALNNPANATLKMCIQAGFCPGTYTPLTIAIPGRTFSMAGPLASPPLFGSSGAPCSGANPTKCRFAVVSDFRGLCTTGSACHATAFISIRLRSFLLASDGKLDMASGRVFSDVMVPVSLIKQEMANSLGAGANPCLPGSFLVGALCVKQSCLQVP